MKPISFIIITYNRPGDTLELLQNIQSLNRAAELLEEVIVVNNASTDDYTAVKKYVSDHTNIPFPEPLISVLCNFIIYRQFIPQK